ncbi:MAG: suppressor of fused domain protein [Clostridiales bacterium]|nr:suppressor of fused domain protein [Clostridiales bacterium]
MKKIISLILLLSCIFGMCLYGHALTKEQMDKFTVHCDAYLGQSDSLVIHSTLNFPLHVDILLYKPTKNLPYWKMITMGASDFRMPINGYYPFGNQYGDRNEYIIFIDKSEDLSDYNTAVAYARHLLQVAHYPQLDNSFLTFGHSIEWETYDGDEMAGAYIELPMIMEDVGFAFFELDPDYKIVILQPVFLTQSEIQNLLEVGSQEFDNYLYPNNGRPHFLCELHRSDLF